MKNKIILSSLFVLSLFLESCDSISLATLPNEIELGKSQVYMNGAIVNYSPNITYNVSASQEFFSVTFRELKDNNQTQNTVSFAFLPSEEGYYILHTEPYSYVDGKFIYSTGAYTSFWQTVEVDLPGYEYKLIDEEEGFIEITTLDLANRQISGRFQASFKRTSKNGVKGQDLPRRIVMQGVFNELF